MADADRCPDCGSELPLNAAKGLCPRCLHQQGLDSDAFGLVPGVSPATTMAPDSGWDGSSVLASLAESVGPVPRVLLRDSEPATDPGPFVKPGSPEMPPSPDPAGLQLLGEIARGGMGAVLKGRDPDLGRDLAVKVLLEQHRDNPRLIRRFLEEAQIAGQLQHPGVVPVYELGAFADRRPYFTMKLVKGLTLADLLDARPDPAADQSRVLGIFLQICQTVAYAHARGVIHRDLKPTNVMVGSFGEVQVMDWGLAKVLPRGGVIDDAQAGKLDRQETVIATDRSGSGEPGLSRAGSVMGTPSFMAPEQARGEGERVDERADVFALGSILCEILTGQPAFRGRSSDEILRKAALGDLANATARLDTCGADAELIAIAKDCLEREAEDRPRHAGAVAERVTAYLGGVQDRLRAAEIARAAESARAEEATHTAAEANERARVERRARRFQVGLAASLLALTTMGGLTFTYLLQQHQQRAARLGQVLAEATALRDRARREGGDVGAWRDALAALERAEGRGPEVEALRAEIEAGREEAERDVRLRQELVEVRANLLDAGAEGTDAAYATAFRDAGLDLDALAPDEFARRLRRQPEAVVIELSAFLDHWSAIRRTANRPVAAWRKPMEMARLADREPYRDRLRAILLAEDRKPQAEALKALAAAPESAELPAPAAVLLGKTLVDLGQAEAAAALLRAAAGRHPGDAWVNHVLASTLDRLRPSAREEAVRYYTAARALRPETAHELAHVLERMGRGDEAESVFRDLTNRRPEDARHLGCLATHLKEKGRAADAAPFLERAVVAYRTAIRLNPDDTKAHDSLGDVLAAQGKWDEAVVAYRTAIRLNPDNAGAHDSLGDVLAAQGKRDEAVAELRTVIRLKPTAEAHNNLGNILDAQGKRDEAVAEFRTAIRLQPDLFQAHSNLGAILNAQGKRDEAVAEFRTAIRLQPDLFKSHLNLGIVLNAQGKVDEAVAEYRIAIRLKPDLFQAHVNLGAILCDVVHDYDGAIVAFRTAIRLQPDRADAHYNLGNVLRAQEKWAEAVAEYRTAIRLQPDTVSAHSNLGLALEGQGKVAEAVDAYRTAIRLQPDRAQAHSNLGDVLKAQGKWDEAVAELRTAIRLQPDLAQAHSDLGAALAGQGKVAEAVAECRTALRLQPDDAEAHFNMGAALAGQGKVAEAVAEYRTAIRLQPDLVIAHFTLGFRLVALRRYGEAVDTYRQVSRLDGKHVGQGILNLASLLERTGRYDDAARTYREILRMVEEDPHPDMPAKARVAEIQARLVEVERFRVLDRRFAAIVQDKAQPSDAGERLDFAHMAAGRGLHASAARLWAEALAAEPKLGDDRQGGHRYNAACAAALAGTGQGTDDPRPDDAARARLRGQALDWLKAERAAWAKVLDSGGPRARPLVQQTLEYWRVDPDLAGVRDADALAKPPEAERVAWRSLWVEVDTLLARARGGRP